MIGNVGNVDFCAAVEGSVTSVNQNSTNLNVNGNVNTNRNVISQTGLNSPNLAVNTNTNVNSNNEIPIQLENGDQAKKMTTKTIVKI